MEDEKKELAEKLNKLKATMEKWTLLLNGFEAYALGNDGVFDAVEKAQIAYLKGEIKSIETHIVKVEKKKGLISVPTTAMPVPETAGNEELVSGEDETRGGDDKDTDDIDEFLDERDITDTKSIIILTFKKFVGITVGHLQKLKTKIDLIGAKAHEKDTVKIGVVNAIDIQFTTGESGDYDAKTHIQNRISDDLKGIFNGKSKVSLSEFCTTLSASITPLISTFQGDINALKKKHGKKYARYTKYPYPSVGDMLTIIKTYTVKFDEGGEKARIDKLLAELDAWYQEMLGNISTLLNQYKDDFFDVEKLKASLERFAESHKATPLKYMNELVGAVIGGLPADKLSETEPILLKIEQNLKNLKDEIVVNILTSDEATKLEGSDNAPGFIGIVPIEYKNALERDTIEKSHFADYLKLLQDKLDEIDNHVNDMATKEEWIKYSYRTNDLIVLLDSLFNIKGEPLANLEKLSKATIQGLRAKGTAFIDIADIDKAMGIAINQIKTTLASDAKAAYKTMLINGTATEGLADLGRVLPTTGQVQGAIEKSKEDIILNREIQYLTFGARLEWNPRVPAINTVIYDFIEKLNLPQMIKDLEASIRKMAATGMQVSKWVHFIKMPPFVLPNVGQMILDVFVAVLGPYIADGLHSFANKIDELQKMLIEKLKKQFPGTEPNPVEIKVNIPIVLNLDLDRNGKPYTYASVKDGVSENVMLSIGNATVYQLSPAAVISNTAIDQTHQVKTSGSVFIQFENPGYGVDVSAGISFFMDIGISVSEILKHSQQRLELKYEFSSIYNGGAKTMAVNLNMIEASYEPTFEELKATPALKKTKGEILSLAAFK